MGDRNKSILLHAMSGLSVRLTEGRGGESLLTPPVTMCLPALFYQLRLMANCREGAIIGFPDSERVYKLVSHA